MTKDLLLQIMRENRGLLTLLFLTCLICGGIWYAVFQQQIELGKQMTAWNARRLGAVGMNNEWYYTQKERMDRLSASIPATHNLPQVLDSIRKLMIRRNTIPGQLAYKPAKCDLKGIVAYSLHCSANGEYPALKHLIAALERLDGISTLDSATLSRKDPAQREPTLDAQLTIYLREARP